MSDKSSGSLLDTYFFVTSGDSNASTVSSLTILPQLLPMHCILALSPSVLILPLRYSVQQSLQNLCSQENASVFASTSLAEKSEQQIGHSNGAVAGVDLFLLTGEAGTLRCEARVRRGVEDDAVVEGRATVRVDGDVGGDRPAEWRAAAGSFQNCSVSFSEFHV